jgi:hypothetical protein
MNCHKDEWSDQKIPLQLHHIDGNSGNNMPDNLQLLCPTCHSQTDTYSGKNIGRGRYKTGLKVFHGFQKTGISKSCLHCSKVIMTMSHKSQNYCDSICVEAHKRVKNSIKLNDMKISYELSPKRCLNCEIIIPFDAKGNYKKQKFCSRKCIKPLSDEENKRYLKLSKTKEDSCERFLLGNIRITETIKKFL